MNLPSEDTLRDLYAHYSYESVGRLEAVPDFVHMRLRELAQQCEPFAQFRRMLDVGFGAGASLKAFDDAGWEAHGIETSSLAVDQARAHGFRHATQGEFLRAPYELGFFDLITMTELIEHLVSPIEFLKQAARLLRPGGTLYLTTPNGNGVSARILGIAWSIAKPPDHLNLFSPRSVRLAFERAGFRRTEVRALGVYPGEIIGHFRRRLPLQRNHAMQVDTASRYALNRSLTMSPSGRIVKRVVNEGLSVMRVGDSLKAFAHTAET